MERIRVRLIYINESTGEVEVENTFYGNEEQALDYSRKSGHRCKIYNHTEELIHDIIPDIHRHKKHYEHEEDYNLRVVDR